MPTPTSTIKRLVSLYRQAHTALVRERDHHIRRAAACAKATVKTKSEARRAALKVRGREHIVDARRLAAAIARLDARLVGKAPAKKAPTKKAPAKKSPTKKTPTKKPPAKKR